MAIKFDKQMILKHRFWVMLGVSVVLILIGIAILQVSEAGGRNTLLAALKEGNVTKATESPKTIDHYKENADLAKNNEAAVWKKAYDPQADLYTWPNPVEEKFDFANGYFANEVKISKLVEPKSWPADTPFLMHGAFVRQEEEWFEIKDRKGTLRKFFLTKRSEKILADDGKPVGFRELNQNAQKKLLAVGYQRGMYFADPLTPAESRLFKTTYKEQIAPILESVDPLDDKLNGVVQLRGWLYKKDTLPHEAGVVDYRFIRYVTQDWPTEGKDINKEAWIAQEDLWIQKEIYRLIKTANDGVSNFTPLFKGKNNERNKAYAFQNSYFDLELMLDKNDALSFKIKNRLARKQSVDLSFRVLLNNAKGHKEEIIKISGFPLMPAGAKDNGEKDRDYLTKSFPKEKDERTGVYSVQQVLNWQTAAVKRIDQISIGSNDGNDMSHSQRTFPVGLRPFDDKEMLARVEVKGPAAGAGPKGRTPPKSAPQPKDKKVAAALPVRGAGNSGPIKMDLWTDRYVEVTEQARRLPVAVVLIVDQDHVDRVLTAFNNSKLRFLETQVLLNQYAGSLQPPAVEDKAEAAPARPNFVPGPFGPKGPIGPIRAAEPSSGADLETNMELVIYGIVTLYQRFPPRPAMAPLEK